MKKKISRKGFFKGLALGTLSLPFILRSCGGGQYQAQQTGGVRGSFSEQFNWRMVTTWPPNFPVLGEGCVLFARWVEEMSAGRLKIKVYGGGELVPALETFDAVRSKAAEMGSGASYYWVGKAPAAAFFTAVPFGMNAQMINAWMLSGDGWKLYQELYDQFGLVVIPAGNTGVQAGGWFNRAIDSLDDLDGLKMRIPGLGGRVLAKAGGTPVLLSGGEIFTGLERGVIDATEWIGPYHDYLMGFHQIAKYYYVPGWHEPAAELEIIVNKEKFEELPADLQQIVITAALRLNHWVLSEFECKNAEYLEKLVNEEKVEIRHYPTEVLQKLRSFRDEVIEEMTANDPFAKKVYDNYDRFRRRMEFWAKSSEKLYYDQFIRS